MGPRRCLGVPFAVRGITQNRRLSKHREWRVDVMVTALERCEGCGWPISVGRIGTCLFQQKVRSKEKRPLSNIASAI
jgi:hypothetical protein